MSDTHYTVYACCPVCMGVVGILTAPDEADSRRDEVVVTDAGFRPYVTGPGATTAYLVGYKLVEGCAHAHVFQEPT